MRIRGHILIASPSIILSAGLIACGPSPHDGEIPTVPVVRADASQPRPFHANISFGESFPDAPARCPEGPGKGGFTAVRGGEATHLGQVTVSESGCTDFLSVPPTVTLIEITLEAANGDQLFVTAGGPIGPGGAIEVAMQIVGGTGRFAGASGGGLITNPGVTQHLPFHYDGHVVY